MKNTDYRVMRCNVKVVQSKRLAKRIRMSIMPIQELQMSNTLSVVFIVLFLYVVGWCALFGLCPLFAAS